MGVDLGTKVETGKILYLEIDPIVEGEIKVEIEEITIIEIIIDPIIEIDQEADGTTIGQVIEVTITRLTIDAGNTRPNYRQNVQWTVEQKSK